MRNLAGIALTLNPKPLNPKPLMSSLQRVTYMLHAKVALSKTHGGLSKLWSLFGSPKLGPVLGPVL